MTEITTTVFCTLVAVALAPLQAQTETFLYTFPGPPHGQRPYAGVIRDTSGNLYGTTERGGYANWGVLYKLDAAGHQTVLHNFTGHGDGRLPEGEVIRDASGNLYGTTEFGGASDFGTVYKVDPAGQETILYGFGARVARSPSPASRLTLPGTSTVRRFPAAHPAWAWCSNSMRPAATLCCTTSSEAMTVASLTRV